MERWRVRRDWLRFSRALHVAPQADLALVGTTQEAYFLPETLPQPEWICYCAGVGRRSAELELADRFEARHMHSTRHLGRSTSPHRSRRRTSRLHFHPVGLWSDTEQTFWAPQDQAHVSYSIPNIQHTDTHFTAVCRRPSSVMRELGHDRIDLLANIEGAEYGVFDSLAEDELFPRLILVHMHVLDSVSDALLSGASARGAGLRGHSRVPDVRHVASLRPRQRQHQATDGSECR